MASARVLPQLVPQNVPVFDRQPGKLPFPIIRNRVSTNTPIPFASPTPDPQTSAFLRSSYHALFHAHGPQNWWPGRSRFEIIVGAILTQNTSWTNVERAIRNLREARVLSASAMRRIHFMKLAKLLRPSGYYRQKTQTLKFFVNFLYRSHGGSLTRMLATPTLPLRNQLLALRGIGPETADSILLYAGKHTVFVVDAYTHRIFGRHGITDGKPDYEKVRAFIETSIPRQPELFNEFHALIVNTGKNWCRKSVPRCGECPLRLLLPVNSPLSKFTEILPVGTSSLAGSLA